MINSWQKLVAFAKALTIWLMLLTAVLGVLNLMFYDLVHITSADVTDLKGHDIRVYPFGHYYFLVILLLLSASILLLMYDEFVRDEQKMERERRAQSPDLGKGDYHVM